MVKPSGKARSSGAATVVVRNAAPVGGGKELTYNAGDTIDPTVRSDTADEVQFHGYDVHKDVAAGGSVRFRFPATIDGRFIVELENHKQTLAEVTVERRRGLRWALGQAGRERLGLWEWGACLRA